MAVSRETWAEIRKGIRDSWVVGLGLIPLGLAFGLLMTHSGFAWWWTPIFSVVIYAGSMEFLAIDMVRSGVGPLSAALTGFMVNFRHIFYGLTFPRNVVRPGAATLYSTYALTDEAYAIGSALRAREVPTGTRVVTIQAVVNIAWVLSGVVGALAGNLLPAGIEGMEFALTALFAVLAVDAFDAARDYSAPLTALVLALIAAALMPGQMLIVALIAYLAVLLARFWWPKLDGVMTWRRR